MDLSIPVALLHVAAFSMGYFICKGLGFNEKTCRTVSIETGRWLAMPFKCCIPVLAQLSTRASTASAHTGRLQLTQSTAYCCAQCIGTIGRYRSRDIINPDGRR